MDFGCGCWWLLDSLLTCPWCYFPFHRQWGASAFQSALQSLERGVWVGVRAVASLDVWSGTSRRQVLLAELFSVPHASSTFKVLWVHRNFEQIRDEGILFSKRQKGIFVGRAFYNNFAVSYTFICKFSLLQLCFIFPRVCQRPLYCWGGVKFPHISGRPHNILDL